MFYREVIFIFFPGIKNFIGATNDTVGLDFGGFESFAYSFVKSPNASSVIRGKGVIDGRSSVSEDRTFTLSFTCSEDHFYDLIFFYYLSGIFGLIPMKNSEIFDKVFTPYGEYLKTDIFSSILDSDSKEFKTVGDSISSSVKKALSSSDNNFFVLLKRMSVKTIPGTTLTFVVELELIPYFNSLNLVLRNNSFFSAYKTNFGKKSNVIKELYKKVKSKPIKVDSNLSLVPVIKTHMSVGAVDSDKLSASLLPSLEIDSKFITNLEVVLYNNIVSLPLQSYSPSFQHLGKGEVGITIGLDFARDFGNNSDSFSKVSKQFNLMSRMNHKTHYLGVKHWLFDCFDLTNFYMQGCTILDKESDTSQQSAISVFFLANSYTHDELLFNAYKTRASDYTPEVQTTNALGTFLFFLKDYKTSKKAKEDYIGASILAEYIFDFDTKFPDVKTVNEFFFKGGGEHSPYISYGTLLCMLASNEKHKGKLTTAFLNNSNVRNLVGGFIFSEIFSPPAPNVVYASADDLEFKKYCMFYFYSQFFGFYFEFALNGSDSRSAFDSSFASFYNNQQSIRASINFEFEKNKSMFNTQNVSLSDFASSAEKIVVGELSKLKASFSSSSKLNNTLRQLLIEIGISESFFFFFQTEIFSDVLFSDGVSIQGFDSLMLATANEFFTISSSYLANDTVYNHLKKKDSVNNPLLPEKSFFSMSVAGTSDYNLPNLDYDVYFAKNNSEGSSFWGANGHPSDLIKESLGNINLSSLASDIYSIFNDYEVKGDYLKGVVLEDDKKEKLSLANGIFEEVGKLSKSSSEQIRQRLDKCSVLCSTQLYDFMPVIYLEFCNKGTVNFNSSTLDQYHSLNSYGYANKIVDTAVTTDPNTRIKTCKITLLDVEFIKKTVVNNKTYVVPDGKVALDPRFEYNPQNFPIGIGSRICLSTGPSKKELNTIFTGTVESVSIDTEKNYLILECASFAKTVYSGDYKVSVGPGGRGLIENTFSWDNLANSFEFIKRRHTYDDTFYKNLHKLHTTGVALSEGVNKSFIPASEYPLEYFMSTDFQITSYYILSSYLSQAAKTYLQSLNEINGSGSLSYISNKTRSTYGGWSLVKKNVDNGSILKNINNVDFDFDFYGTRKSGKLNDKNLYYNTSPYCDFIFNVSGNKPSKEGAAKVVGALQLAANVSLSLVTLKLNAAVGEIMESVGVLDKKTYYKNESNDDGVAQTYRKKSVTIADLLNDMENRYSGALWDVLEDGRGATLFFGRSNYFVKKVKSPYTFGLEQLEFIQNVKFDAGVETSITRITKSFENTVSKRTYKSNNTEPYRNQFVAISGVNLISCHIESNMNIANTAVVHYDYSFISDLTTGFWHLLGKALPGGTGDLGKITVASLANAPEELQIPIKNTKESEENINSESQAYEYGLSMLEKEYAKFYSGKIVLTYSPEVRVGTELFISDPYNKIFGSVICSNVSHYCNAEEGFITVVTPAMKVDNNSPNESLSLNLKGLAVAENRAKFFKYPDFNKISSTVETINMPIFTSAGIISSKVTKKDSKYEFNQNLNFPSDYSLSIGCTFYPIQHNGKIMSPYSEDLKAYSIGAAHSATVLEKAGRTSSKASYAVQAWYSGILNWFGDLGEAISGLRFEKTPGFYLLDLMKVEETETYKSPVINNDVQSNTFFIAVSKNYIFDAFKNEAIIGDIITTLKSSNPYKEPRRHTGFYILDPKSKEFASYKVILSTITEGGTTNKTSYGLAGFTEVLGNTPAPESYRPLFGPKVDKITLLSVHNIFLAKGIVFEYFFNYLAAYNFANFIKKQGVHNAILINLGLDAAVKSSLFKSSTYSDQSFRAELAAIFKNSLITATKAKLSYKNAVFVNFSHNFKDPDLASYIKGEKQGVIDAYLNGTINPAGSYFIPKDTRKSYDLLRSILEVTSKDLGGTAIHGYDSDIDLYNTIVTETELRKVVAFKGPTPLKLLANSTYFSNDYYKNDLANKFYNKIINTTIPDNIGNRTFTKDTGTNIRKALSIHKMTLEGRVVYPTFFFPDSTNFVIARNLICLTLSVLSESKTFMSILKTLANKSSLYLFLSDEKNKKIRKVFSAFIESKIDLKEDVYNSFKEYSHNLSVAINDFFGPFVEYMPNFSKITFRYFDAGYWNSENCDFPYGTFYKGDGNPRGVSSDGKEFLLFIFKMFGMAQASYFSKITVHNEVYFSYLPGIEPLGEFDFKKTNNTFFKFVSELIYVHTRVLKNYYTGSSGGISESQICLKEVRSFTFDKTSRREYALIVSDDTNISKKASVYKSSFTEIKSENIKDVKKTDFSIVKINVPKLGGDAKNTDLFFVHMPETIVNSDANSNINNQVKAEALFNLLSSKEVESDDAVQSFLLGDVNFNTRNDGKLSIAADNAAKKSSFKKIKGFEPESRGAKHEGKSTDKFSELDQIYYKKNALFQPSLSFYCASSIYLTNVDNKIAASPKKLYSNHPAIFVKSTNDKITDSDAKKLFGSFVPGSDNKVTEPKIKLFKN